MILIVSAVFPPEPIVSANLSFDIACKLSEHYEVTVVSPNPSRPLNKQFVLNETNPYSFTHHVLRSYTCAKSRIFGRLRESYSFGIATVRYIAKNHHRIDTIYANTWPLFAQYYLIKSAKKYKIPVVLHVQDIYPESIIAKMPFVFGIILKILFIPFDSYILRSAKHIITISPHMKEYLSMFRKLTDSNISVIRNWQNDESFQQIDTIKIPSTKTFRFMYLGSISPSAGVELLIKAFAKANLQNSSLIIAGDGSDKDLCLKIAKDYPKVKIEFWDAPIAKVPKIQSLANVMLLPLRKGIAKTASPSKLPAYMFSKKPIIACLDINSDPSDIIVNACCGWIIEPENIDLLAETMIKVRQLSDNELKQIGQNGYSYAMRYLSKKKNLPQILKIIVETV